MIDAGHDDAVLLLGLGGAVVLLVAATIGFWALM